VADRREARRELDVVGRSGRETGQDEAPRGDVRKRDLRLGGRRLRGEEERMDSFDPLPVVLVRAGRLVDTVAGTVRTSSGTTDDAVVFKQRL